MNFQKYKKELTNEISNTLGSYFNVESGLIEEIVKKNINNFIKESLIKTYPSVKTVQYLDRQLADKLNYIYKIIPDKYSDGTIGHCIDVILHKSEYTENSFNQIDDIMEYCGYNFSNKKKSKGDVIVLTFEPKYKTMPSNNTEKKYLYHVTNEKVLNKIFNKGIVPKSSTNKNGYSYPERVYLFKDANLAFQYLAFLKMKNKSERFAILVIDLNKINYDVKLHDDVMFLNNGKCYAVWTYEPIPPYSISVAQRV